MASRTRNITIDQGADYTQDFVVYEKPSSTLSLSITAEYWANSQLRKSYMHSNSVLTFETTILVSNNSVRLQANNNITSKVKGGRYLYDIILTNPTVNPDTKIKIQEGIATVAPSVEVGSMYTTNSTGLDDSSNYN